MIDVAELTLLPRRRHALAGKAPGIGLDTIRNSGRHIWRQRQDGHLDLTVGTRWGAEKGLYWQPPDRRNLCRNRPQGTPYHQAY